MTPQINEVPKACHYCQYVYRERFPVPVWARHIFCTHPSFKPVKLIDFLKMIDERKVKPDWCPFVYIFPHPNHPSAHKIRR